MVSYFYYFNILDTSALSSDDLVMLKKSLSQVMEVTIFMKDNKTAVGALEEFRTNEDYYGLEVHLEQGSNALTLEANEVVCLIFALMSGH